MALPPELLQAVSSPGGGKIALVLGAGCSVRLPRIFLCHACVQRKSIAGLSLMAYFKMVTARIQPIFQPLPMLFSISEIRNATLSSVFATSMG